jgi:hypothetical protein
MVLLAGIGRIARAGRPGPGDSAYRKCGGRVGYNDQAAT